MAAPRWPLSARMGLARARRFVLMGEMMSSAEAEKCGLVDFVVDDNVVLAEAEKTAARLAKGPTRAYGEIRRCFTKAYSQSLESQLEDEAQALSRSAGTADAREGITAFVEKRKANFTGNGKTLPALSIKRGQIPCGCTPISKRLPTFQGIT